MKVLDWREAASATVATILGAEARWWRAHLGWDLGPAFAGLESMRVSGQLPGLFVLAADGSIAAWGFFTGDDDVVQIGAMGAANAAAGVILVRTILEAAEDVGASTVVAFARPAAPGVTEALLAAGFAMDAYRYLEAPTRHFRGFAAELRTCSEADFANLPRLLERSYRDSTELRPFAPRGTAREWTTYVGQLLHTRGCGDFQVRSSIVSGVAPLDGAALVTAIGDSTAHLAQLAVDPSARGRGLGQRLVEAAGSSARARGFSSMTLLVSESNAPAQALYDRLGFSKTAAFMAAVWRQPRLLTSEGVAAGGARTFR
jgi:ribosomal protein S18 acetylase RimI-like enzyme